MLKREEKSLSAIDFFKYFQKLVGYHLYVFLVFNLLVGLTDGFGLAMFIPLLALATGAENIDSTAGGKTLEFLPNFLNYFNISLTLTSILIIMLALFSTKAILIYLRDLYFAKLRLSSIRKIRFELVNTFKSLSYKGYTSIDPGQIQFAMIGEAQRLISALTNLIRSFQSTVILLTYIFLAFIANWQFAILVAIGGILSNFIYKFINQVTRRRAKELSRIGNKFNSFLIQSIQNFKYLKSTNSFIKYEKNLKSSILSYEETQFNIGKLNAIASSLREPIIIIIISIVLVIHIKFLSGAFGGILVSLLLFYRALSYLVSMQDTWNNFLGNSAALDAILELINKFKKDTEPSQKSGAFTTIHSVELKDTSLKFDNTTIIKNVNLLIQDKKTIAFVGESGAGKSTLANIISGLIKPSSGEIIINNSPLRDEFLDEYRNQIGYISQEPVIFDDTIYNNITFWEEKTPENLAKFNECINLVHLKNHINSLTLKEDTPLGNDGILISGGQKQRISIARELYRNVNFLILDEATSALDSETENIIKENIENLHGKYTIIIIAHRLSTIKHADTIFVLKKGKIIDQGCYNHLYKNSDIFKRMVDLQEL